MATQTDDILTGGLASGNVDAILTGGLSEGESSGGGGNNTAWDPSGFQNISGGVALLPLPGGSYRDMACFQDDLPLWSFQLVDEDGGPDGRPIAIPAGSTVTVTTSLLGSILTEANAGNVTILYAALGIVAYQAKSADTLTVGRLRLTLTVTTSGGQVDTYGPAIIQVCAK